MNFANMMQQAQKMQKKIQDAQAELASLELTGEAGDGAVSVVCNGLGKVQKVKLTAKAINPENPESVDTDTLEMLEDLIMQAVKIAEGKATAKSESTMKSITGGINIPGLF